MKQLFSFLILSIMIFPQTGTLKGKVTDVETGKPLIGASLNIETIKKGAATIGGGEYLVTKVAEGKYDILASYPGYRTVVVKNVEISSLGPTELNVSLPRNNSFQMPKQQESFYLQQIPENLQKKLSELKEVNEAEYYRSLQETYFEYLLQEDKTNKLESELMQTDIECKLIVSDYKKAANDKRAFFYNELKEKLSYQFDLKQKLRLRNLSELSQKIDTLEKALNDSKMNKEIYIKETIQQLLKN